MEDVELAAAIAGSAGEILLSLRNSRLFEGKALGRAGDDLANRFILAALAEHRSADAILSEEAADDRTRLAAERVWIVDPLDGTREYSEGRLDWAVHIALAVAGEPRIGAVSLPATRLMLRSDAPPPAPPQPRAMLRIVVSRTRPPAEAEKVAQLLGAELVAMGSSGAKTMAVVQGEADIYLHSGGQYEWDSCAPVAVALAAGLHCSRIDGSPLRYNQASLYVPDLLVCRKELAASLLSMLAALRTG